MTKKVKIILSTILSVCIVASMATALVMLPATHNNAVAADASTGMTNEGWTAHQNAFGTKTHSHSSGKALNSVAATDGVTFITSGGSYYLSADFDGVVVVTGSSPVTLCLNGYMLSGVEYTYTRAYSDSSSTYTPDYGAVTVGDYTSSSTKTFTYNPGHLTIVDCCPGSTCSVESHKHEYGIEMGTLDSPYTDGSVIVPGVPTTPTTGSLVNSYASDGTIPWYYDFSATGGGYVYGGVITYPYQFYSGIRVYQSSALTFHGGTVAGVQCDSGVVVQEDAIFSMTGGTIAGNRAPGGHTVYTSTESAPNTKHNSSPVDNIYGGGVANYGTFTMTGGAISHNVCTFHVLLAEGTSGRRYEYYFSYGGGIYNVGTCTLTGATVSDNRSYSLGSGIYNCDGSLTVTDCTIRDNVAEGRRSNRTTLNIDYGGGVYNSGNFTMRDSRIISNTGCGVYNVSTFISYTSSISANTGSCGGVYNTDSFTMEGGFIDSNIATSSGGGVYNSGTFTMNDGTISHNQTSANYGGGVYNSSSFYLRGGSIVDNSAKSNGAGVYNNGSIYVSGSPVIEINFLTDTSTASNLYLYRNPITIDGALGRNCWIGISVYATYFRDGTAFTSGYSANSSGIEPYRIFFADDSAYGVHLNDEGEAYLGDYFIVPDDGHQHDGTEYAPLSEALEEGTTFTAGYYFLDSGATTSITITGKVTICLNGNTLTGSGNAAITVSVGASFTLCDCHDSGSVTGGTHGLYVEGSATIEGGSFTGSSGYGVYASSTGTLNVNNGSIDKLSSAGTTNINDGAVTNLTSSGTTYLNNGTVNALSCSGNTYLNGGSVTASLTSNGITYINGSAVNCDVTVQSSTLTLASGTFGHNVTVQENGAFIMSGSLAVNITSHGSLTISGGSAQAVEARGMTLIYGGTLASLNSYGTTVIYDQAKLTGSGSGTGVTVSDGTTTMAGGAISGYATGAQVNGGTFSAMAGSITGVTTGVDVAGGAFSINGNPTITASATGVNVGNGEMSMMGGPAITGTTSGIYLPTGKVINVTGALSCSPISVTMQEASGGIVTSGYVANNPDASASAYFYPTQSLRIKLTDGEVEFYNNHLHGEKVFTQFTGNSTITSGNLYFENEYNGDIVITGTAELCLNGFTYTGTITVNEGANFVLCDCQNYATAAKVIVNGTATIDGPREVTTLDSNNVTNVVGGTVKTLNVNGGTLNVDGGTVTALTVNNGEAYFDGGTVNTIEMIGGSAFLDGDCEITSANVAFGTTFTLNGGYASYINSAGDVLIDGGAMVNELNIVSGTATVIGGTIETLSATSGTVDILGGVVQSIDLDGAMVTLDQYGFIDTDIQVKSGSMFLKGGMFFNTVTVTSGGLLNISNSGTARAIVTSGNVIISKDASIFNSVGAAITVNGGTVTISGGTVEGTVGIDALGGTVNLIGGTVTGTQVGVQVSEGAMFNLLGTASVNTVVTSGTFTMGSDAIVTGNGTGASFTVLGGTTTMTGGTIQGGEIGVQVSDGIFALADGTISGSVTGVLADGGMFLMANGTVTGGQNGILQTGSGMAIQAGGTVSPEDQASQLFN